MSQIQLLFKNFLAIIILSNVLNVSSQVTLTEENMTLPTYEVLPGESAPIFFSNENFQGARRVIYPYALNDVISHDKIMKEWKALNLENEFIKLCITPEIGGKIYYAQDKTNNYNFIYKNNEVKPANIGMTGAWVSGGIEWCVLHHHRASTMLPMDYATHENEDGSKTIFIGETEPRHRMRWNVAITLSPGKSYFEAEVTIYNPTPYTNTFLYWANVATHVNKDYQTIFPPSVQLATFHSKNQFTRWPISTEVFRTQDFTSGVDVSWWKNVKENASFFSWDLKEDFMGGYDHGQNSGTVHVGDHNVIKGAKLWEWGSGPVGQATEARLTETSGPYVEIMVGAFSDNQPDYTWIKPFETKKWKQYWYPVRDIGGFKKANIDAAVNLEKTDDNKVMLGYYSTQTLENARVILKQDGQVIFTKDISISPAKAFKASIQIQPSENLTDLQTELIDLNSSSVILSYQPKKLSPIKELPEPVTRPDTPEEISSVEELYLTGKRLEQFYKYPDKYYEEVLKRDPEDTRTLTEMGKSELKNGNYPAARKRFSKAIKRLTKDYTRPSSGEALFFQGVTLKAMGLYEAAKDTLYRASWDYAYYGSSLFELSQISCKDQNWGKALEQIDNSLSTNTLNHRAIGLKVSILRKLEQYDDAQKILEEASAKDPLNFRFTNEMYLVAKEAGNKEFAAQALESMHIKMRDFDQNYLELAVEYVNDGMLDEAKEVLASYQGENPIVSYYLGYIEHHKGNTSEAKKLFTEANGLSEKGCFPFRLETINILQAALEYNGNDGKAQYYLGNILYNKQPELAIQYWEKSIVNEPKLAMSFRNLGWGYFKHFENYEKAISYYEKALKLEDQEAIFYEELDDIYQLNNSSIATRLSIFEGKGAIVRQRDMAMVSYVTVLTLAGQPEVAINELQGKEFSFREGNSAVREMIIDAQLSLGIQYYNQKEYQKSLDQFLLARVPDEEAGSARAGNRMIQVNYYIGLAYEGLKDKANAKKYFEMATVKKEHTSRKKSKVKGFMNYYQALSFEKLGEKNKAKEIFELLVAKGEAGLNPDSDDPNSYFQIFGGKENENVSKSFAYTTRGLGYKGLGKKGLAKSDLSEASTIYTANLWAQIELDELN